MLDSPMTSLQNKHKYHITTAIGSSHLLPFIQAEIPKFKYFNLNSIFSSNPDSFSFPSYCSNISLSSSPRHNLPANFKVNSPKITCGEKRAKSF